MKATGFLCLGLFVCAVAVPAVAETITVSGAAAFTGFNNTWSFSYTTGSSNVNLQQITIDLSPTNIRFDTAAGGFGSLGFQDVGNYNGTDLTTGLSSASPTGTGLDGGSILTFVFADFAVGNTFTFSADVDHPNPTLLTLNTCTGTALQRAVCNAANTAKTVTNDGLLLGADTVLSPQLANALVTFQFGGTGYETVSVTAPLEAATLPDIINGLLNGNLNAVASTTNPSEQISAPEPATTGAPLLALGFFAAFARRRR